MWTQVDQVRARQSPWFGVKGSLKGALWLMLIMAVIGLVRTVILGIEILRVFDSSGLVLAVAVLALLNLLLYAWMLHVTLNGLAGVRSFARAAPLLLGTLIAVHCARFAFIAIQLGGERFQGALQRLLPEFIAILAVLVGLLVYMLRSRRVNATYRYRLPADEAAKAAAA